MVVPHPRIDTYALLTRPPLTELPLPVRLACVKHAASVHSEPGSNSQVHLSPAIAPQRGRCRDINEQTRTLWSAPTTPASATMTRDSFKAYCNASRRYATERLKAKTNEIQVLLKPRPLVRPLDQLRARARNPRAPPTYPFLAYATVKDRVDITHRPAKRAGRLICSDVRQWGAEHQT